MPKPSIILSIIILISKLTAMKRIFFVLFAAWSVMAEQSLPPAPRILAAARAQLPPYPVFMSGSLKEKAPNGFVRKTLKVEMTLDWNAQAPRADYKITDSKAKQVQELKLMLSPDGMNPSFTENGKEASFDPNAEIADSGVTWADLTFAFLWNPNAETVGVERKFGKERYQISIPRPDNRVLQLWVEKDSGRMVQAEERNADGNRIKVIKVVSVKNFDDLWMVKDLDIIQPETGAKASLRIDEVKEVK
ncbi:LolA-like protein [Tichowtungia aerotolerans]|uniref:Outer membrane lipoprotein-sorting protein n=1 Tax=Tichowtungia aerotolerans TaxID=2697043 RepID=A0A6P1M7H0_9BACT|nr:hypothetical protein [Tichowtungia aerotolerans]QHI68993.1 hypothetical protein GT409_05865 [Tichowtungia aerotolerans]